MTREDAILCLKGIKNYGRDTFTEQSDWQESLDMAIKALEQEPCENAISRQAVLNKIIKFSVTDGRSVSVTGLWTEVNELPSVTPQEPILEKIRAEIKEKIEQEEFARSVFRHEEKDTAKAEQCTGSIMAYNNMIKLIDKYKAESEDKDG